MAVEQLLQKLRTLLSDLGPDLREESESPYVSLALDGLVSVMNIIRAAEVAIAAGAARVAVDAMLREHMLARMQREAALMVRLVEPPAIDLEAQLRVRQDPDNKRKARARGGMGVVPGH